MAGRQYFNVKVNDHVGNDTKTATFDVGINEKFTIKKISMTAVSTNADVVEIKDSSGVPYGALTTTNKLGIEIFVPSNILTTGGYELQEPIILDGGKKLYITTLDSSGAPNPIEICLHGKIETG